MSDEKETIEETKEETFEETSVILPVKKRGRPKMFTEEEQRAKRLAQQKQIREKRKEKLTKWRAETSHAQRDLVEVLQNVTIKDEELIKQIESLLKKVTSEILV